MAKQLFKQCIIVSGTERMVCWLDASRIKVGVQITLKDSEKPEKWWKVIHISEPGLQKEEIKDAHESQKWFENDYRRRLMGLKIDG